MGASCAHPRRDRLLEALRDERGPSRLVAGADAVSVVAVEVLVKEKQLPESGVGRPPGVGPVAGAAPVGSHQEHRREAPRELAGDLVEGEVTPGPGGALDLEAVS